MLIYEILKKHGYIDEKKEKYPKIIQERKIFSSYRNDLESRPSKIYEGKIILFNNNEKRGIIVNTNNPNEKITVEGLKEERIIRNIKKIVMAVSR